MSNELSTPEYYGYKIGENIVPYINKCIEDTGECYLSEGTHIVGRSDNDWTKGAPWSDNCIAWGWARKNGVKLIGKGIDQTILKFADNVQSRYLFNQVQPYVLMLQTNYNESCNDNLISGITWDGNYDNNSSTSTIDGIRIRGNNNTVRNCKFINFAVGDNRSAECFQVFLVTIDKNGTGNNVINNIFTSPGNKKNSPAGFCPENTFIGVGGVGAKVQGNIFKNCIYDVVNQQSPCHGITLMQTTNAEVNNNIFDTFQGSCIYMDSWENEGAKIKDNVAKNVWIFFNLSCQAWQDPNQISFNKNFTVSNNDITLTIGDCYYQWDQPAFTSIFTSYVNDPNLDHTKYPGFENILVSNNKVTLGYRLVNNVYSESPKLMCLWGQPITEDKIKLVDNTYVSIVPTVTKKKESFFKKLIDFLFGRK